MPRADLTAKQAAFVQEFLVDLNGTQAAVRAGYSAKTAKVMGARLLQHPEVSAALKEAQAQRAERTQITADDVLQQLWAVATADPNQLVQFRRTCCRHCYGIDHGYQRTQREMDRARAAHEDRMLVEQAAGDEGKVEPFNEGGGVGFDPRLPPHPDCPECFGDGRGEAHIADTRNLSPEAAKLYAGVKVTKDGVEVKMHDKMAALVQVGRHLGMFTDKTELSGKDGGAIAITISPDDDNL